MFFLRKPKAKSEPPVQELDGVCLVRSKAAQRLTLRADPVHGQIRLVVPSRISEKKAWQFAQDHRAWIEQRLIKMPKPVPFAHGSVIPVFGLERRIVVVPASGRVTSITLFDDVLEVRTPRADPSTNIRRYLHDLLHTTIQPLVKTKARATGKRAGTFQLRDTKSRWGSCGPDGNMMFCWRLVFAPLPVIDYVVAHEVAHLRHMDHSPRFWDLCDRLSEDASSSRAWLKKNGDRLLTYDVRS